MAERPRDLPGSRRKGEAKRPWYEAVFEEALAGGEASRAPEGAPREGDAHARGGAGDPDRTHATLPSAQPASSASGAAPPPPTAAGPYRILTEIGRGGMGVVYKAEDPRLGRYVALKFVAPHHTLDPGEARRRLLAEARAVSALDHPNICTVHDVGESGDGRLFFAMAFYQGKTLSQRLREGPLAPEEAVPVLTQVARGLAHAHELGVVHRDVKPSNVLVTGDGEAKILDFGLARSALSELTEPGTRLGTLAYMSPEQARGRPLDHRTDVWSLGVVLHEVLAGRLPLPSESDAALLAALLRDDVPLRLAAAAEVGLPPLWHVIASKALERAPERRYRAMRDMLRDLEELEEECRRGLWTGAPGARSGDLATDPPLRRRSGRSSAGGASRRRVPAPERGEAAAVPHGDLPQGDLLQGDLAQRDHRAVEPSAAASPLRSGASRPRSAASALSGRHRSVGRELELEELRSAWSGCTAGSGLVVCLTGEPGIGKTTVVEDFLAEVEGDGLSFVARGRSTERLAGAEAYLPILEALASLLEGDGRDLAVSLLKETAPTWYVQLAPAALESDSSFRSVALEARVASQERMKRELLAFLQELSLRRPLALFCDDLHWADISTVDLLGYVGSRVDGMRLLVLGTYRPSDLLLAKHPFLNVQRELQSRGLCREIPVRLLDPEAIAAYLAAVFPDHRFPPSFPAAVHARTEGNPLFVTELLSDLRDRGEIERHAEGWRLARPVPAIEGELPESVRGMIERKLDRIEAADRRLLSCAAVQGHEFDSATLAAALGLDAGEVEERLEVLGRVHRVVRALAEDELPNGELTQRYRFVHVLYHNALDAALRPRLRAQLGGAVAEALELSWGDRSGEIAAQLAYLFASARRFERAADRFLQAARAAVAVHATREALELARRALASAERLRGEARHAHVLAAANQIGQLHLTLSQLEEAVEAFAVAERAAAELGDADAQVNAICTAALARFNLKRTEESQREAERALALARETGSVRGAAAAELILGLESLCFGDTGEARQSFDRAVPVLRQEGAPLHALEAIGYAGLLYAWQLDYDVSDRAVGWTLEQSRRLGSSYHTIMNLFVRGMALFNRGRLQEGLTDLEEGWRLAEQNGERYWLSRFPNTLGWAYREIGEWERAHDFDRRGAVIAHENGWGKPEGNSHLNLAQHHLAAGELKAALEHLHRAGEIFEADFWFRWRYSIRLKAELSRYWMRLGDTKLAGALAAESLLLAEPRLARKHMAWAHKLLGDVAVAEERFADGRREYDAALAVLERHRCPIVEWKILLAAADMASAYRDVGLAETYRTRSRAVLHGLGESIVDDRLRRQFLRSAPVAAALL